MLKDLIDKTYLEEEVVIEKSDYLIISSFSGNESFLNNSIF